ncbi:MAG: DUF3343 domain-containing protein [Candidatus Metalachnospira sp.]|nr:DUF3343 domain-containing protein [Candidatus Metalachnospira sp.]
MRKEHYYLLAFNSTHFAISAETYLSKTIHVTIMPTLRKITASCGISIRIEPENYTKAVELINSNPKIKKNSMPYEISDENVIPLSYEN